MSKKEEEKEEININDIYTPLSVAKEEIWRRWNDKELKKKVDEFLGDDLPNVFKKNPKAALFRYIATPNLEFKIFLDLTKLAGLESLFVEFLDDKFCTVNQDKLHMGKMVFYKKNGNGNCRIGKENIIDIMKFDGQSMRKIETLWGESFIDFHHRIFNKDHGSTEIFDAYKFKKNGETPYEVYLKFFSLFICHGIFFEIYYYKNKREKEFFLKTIVPAFKKIEEIFGIKPLVVPLISCLEEDLFLQYYPESVKEHIKDYKAK